MTRYLVEHVTTYDYDAEMAGGHMVAHLVPCTTSSQTVQSSTVTSVPGPADLLTWIDVFGNLCTYLSIEEPHSWLQIAALSDVTVIDPACPTDVAWEQVAHLTTKDTSELGQLAQWCRQDSPLVRASTDLADYALASFVAGQGVVAGLRDLTKRIFADFAFDAEATDLSTPLETVLSNRRGVCQDFAHLAIGCLRSIGLPARYVSGYLETTPPAGVAKLVGADASHAWCSVFVPGFGWVDADPTNGLLPPDRHVTAAWGRDYADVAPVRGVTFGPTATQVLHVSVDVTQLPE
jgi:transglutaminase-like putative cysteine protease